MILSQTCQNGIQACLYLVKNYDDSFIPIKEIAKETELSYHFLGKILQTLTKAGILKSYKGPNGGVELIKSPSEISLFDIIKAIDGEDINKLCMIGIEKCDMNDVCLINKDWGKICHNITSMLKERTLAELVNPTIIQELKPE